jgi:hypothetical protein
MTPMRWLGLTALLLVAACGDDDFNGDSGTIISVDQTLIMDLAPGPLDLTGADLFGIDQAVAPVDMASSD